MSRGRRRFSRDFKVKVVEAYASGVSAIELSRQFELHPNVIYEWSKQYRTDPVHAFESGPDGEPTLRTEEKRIAELERMIGRLTLENEFLEFILNVMGRQSSCQSATFSA